MIRDIKVLGLAVVAVLALGAISASPASAVEFHSEVEKTKYTAEGESNQVLVSPAATITCSDLTFEATTTAKTNAALTVTNIKYSNTNAEGKPTKCITKTIFGNIELNFDFTTDECDYVFHANGDFDIECKKPGGVTIVGPGCSMTLPTQTGLKAVAYDNKEAGAKRDLTFTMRLKGIRGTATGFLCSKGGEFTTGEYTGNVTLKGFKDEAAGAQVGIWVE